MVMVLQLHGIMGFSSGIPVGTAHPRLHSNIGRQWPGWIPCMTASYHMICTVYGDQLHRNNGTHIYGYVSRYNVWQSCWWHIGNTPMRWYNALIDRVGHRFVKRMTTKLKGVRTIY